MPPWTRLGPHLQSRIVAEVEGTKFVMYKIAPNYIVGMHTHAEPQLGVVVSGSGLHRIVLPVRKGGRIRNEITEVTVRPGDCYYIPPDAPHEFRVGSGRPLLCVDVMLSGRRRPLWRPIGVVPKRTRRPSPAGRRATRSA